MFSSYKVCVIGTGYVGEHLIDTFKNYYNIVGVDLNDSRINNLSKKYLDINNVSLQTNYNNLESCNVFLISVPTLVTSNKQIDVSCLNKVEETLKNIVKKGDLIVVESSVYVGATREIFGHYRNKGIYIGFSPERVDPGRIEPKMEDIPKIISGIDKESLDQINNIYNKVIKNIVQVSKTECAEMCKLYENCFRMVNIAYVNEISDMCNKLNIDCDEMINASSTKPFGFMPFYPGIGVGGHCIPVNPYYLFKNGNLPVLQFATELMQSRPKQKAYEILDKFNNPQNILICGIGFKKGESLLTNSPAYSLFNHLKDKNITVYDPIVQKTYKDNDIKFVSEKQMSLKFLNQMDLVIVVHSYKNLLFKKYEKQGGKIVWYTKV